MKPLIGITGWNGKVPSDVTYTSVSTRYVAAVEAAGGVAVVLPPACEPGGTVDPEIARTIVERMDGLLLSGGGDVDSARWGEPLHDKAEVDAARDAMEFAILQEALARDLPVFGICRGCQVLNVAFGGTIDQHIPDQGKDPRHNQTKLDTPLRRSDIGHTVTVQPGTRLAGVLGEGEWGVNSMHHQAVGRLGEGLRPAAFSPDDVVEAIEATGPAWVVGVQWHPEELVGEHPEFTRLFAEFVREAAAYASRRAVPSARSAGA